MGFDNDSYHICVPQIVLLLGLIKFSIEDIDVPTTWPTYVQIPTLDYFYNPVIPMQQPKSLFLMCEAERSGIDCHRPYTALALLRCESTTTIPDHETHFAVRTHKK